MLPPPTHQLNIDHPSSMNELFPRVLHWSSKEMSNCTRRHTSEWRYCISRLLKSSKSSVIPISSGGCGVKHKERKLLYVTLFTSLNHCVLQHCRRMINGHQIWTAINISFIPIIIVWIKWVRIVLHIDVRLNSVTLRHSQECRKGY